METREARQRLDMIDEITEREKFEQPSWAPWVTGVVYGAAVFAAGATGIIWVKLIAAAVLLVIVFVLQKLVKDHRLVLSGEGASRGTIYYFGFVQMWFIAALILFDGAPWWAIGPFSLVAGVHAFLSIRSGKAGF